jgi:hypothetical protein
MRTVCLLMERMLLVGTVTQSPIQVSMVSIARATRSLTSLECQWFTRNHHQVLPSIPSFHAIETSRFVLMELCARAEEQTSSLIRLTAHIASADYTVSICRTKVE